MSTKKNIADNSQNVSKITKQHCLFEKLPEKTASHRHTIFHRKRIYLQQTNYIKYIKYMKSHIGTIFGYDGPPHIHYIETSHSKYCLKVRAWNVAAGCRVFIFYTLFSFLSFRFNSLSLITGVWAYRHSRHRKESMQIS